VKRQWQVNLDCYLKFAAGNSKQPIRDVKLEMESDAGRDAEIVLRFTVRCGKGK
jgi:hypothetical protein